MNETRPPRIRFITPPVDRALRALNEFLQFEAAGGLLLMGAAALAMIVANSPLAGSYFAFLDLPLRIGAGTLHLEKALILWINDGLMAVFFLLVGMELKRELLEGHLSSVRRAMLPAIAALGGMIVPGVIYAAWNWHDPVALRGWAIPTATDIAFALGVLALLGSRIPPGLKALLLSIAIFDDLGAIVIIAMFYTAKLSLLSFGIAVALIAALALLNRANVRRPAAYILVGIPLWIAVLESGVHATLAGVIVAAFIPLRGAGGASEPDEHAPLRRLEHTLHPWVAFGILPLFGFANAGVPLGTVSFADLAGTVPLGIAIGLFAGKQVGIFLACGLAVVARAASLPSGVSWGMVYAMAVLCGIGFTMSLFIASLAFIDHPGAFEGTERLGILLGSIVSGLVGYGLLRIIPARKEP